MTKEDARDTLMQPWQYMQNPPQYVGKDDRCFLAMVMWWTCPQYLKKHEEGKKKRAEMRGGSHIQGSIPLSHLQNEEDADPETGSAVWLNPQSETRCTSYVSKFKQKYANPEAEDFDPEVAVLAGEGLKHGRLWFGDGCVDRRRRRWQRRSGGPGAKGAHGAADSGVPAAADTMMQQMQQSSDDASAAGTEWLMSRRFDFSTGESSCSSTLLHAVDAATAHSAPGTPITVNNLNIIRSMNRGCGRDSFHDEGLVYVNEGDESGCCRPGHSPKDTPEDVSLRRAVLVWSVAAGLTATWYFLKKVPDSSEPEIHIRFEEYVPADEEIEENGIPDSLDWSELGCLPCTPRVISLFYQYFCGSCWAIATVKSVEWAYAIKYGRVFSLSVQQLVDCSSKYAYGDKRQYQGCFGGLLRYAFQYVTETGLTIEKAYPCFLWQGGCKLAGRPIAVRIDGFEEIPPTEDDFIMALQTGPIAVYLYANQYFGFFSGGKILELEDCPSSGPLLGNFHCVVLIGYGIDDDGGKFWKIQNTHGVLWGEDGYARLRRGVSDPHGVACMLMYHGYRPTEQSLSSNLEVPFYAAAGSDYEL
ncbi:hypothetical protein QYE76_033576 [Lolium multiflorum]|uniref:Peptidase C1A papain C-terminal domain-containing protein n=1 Tax=Lolium multiflorum TaxID=4521 RepID=A0AAD8VMH6_LOLMU|nr:hypothetical protein QYE76_033576 [Lolium multiflorum]